MAGFLRFFLLLVLSTVSLCAFGQTSFSARGVLTDPSAAGIPGATVRLESPSGAPLQETVTDAQGAFGFGGVPGGDYVLSVPAFSGFAQGRLPIHLTGNSSGIKMPVRLESVQQEMTVGSEPTLSTESAANRDTISVSGNQLRKLPAFDMDYIGALSSFLDPSAGGVTLVVDGIEMKSAGVSPSAIQEIRINSDPYSTEFTRPGRGRIEITTKPGTQQFHGEGNFIFRDAVFNARNAFATIRPPEVRRLFEGHLSGPVGHGRHTDFIASGEFGQRNLASIVNALTANGPLIDNVITPRLNAQGTMRVTRDFSASHRLQVGYNFEYDSTQYGGVGGLVLREAGYNNQSREDDAIFNDRILVSPALVNQLLVTFEKDEDVTQSVTQAPSVEVNGSFRRGGAQADVSRTENTVHMDDIVSWSHGRHYVRFGGQAPQISRRAVDDHTNRLGTYSFNTLSDYNNRLAHAFAIQQGSGRGIYWINEIGAFIQDQIKLSPRLQLSLGVRYDWQTYIDDRNNFAPRGSIAYAPGKGRTVLRLGSGVFYDRTGGDFPSIAKLHNGLVLDTVQLQDQMYPLLPGTTFAADPSTIVRFAPNARSPYTIQSSVSVERQLTKKLTVSAGYRNSVQVKSFRSRDANAPILPPNPSLNAIYSRPNLGFGQVQQIESGGRQLQNSVDLALRGQISRWFSGQAQYTLSRTRNNTGGIGSFPDDQYDPNNEWGRANSDRLHALNIVGEINPEHWLSFGINAGLYSGTPYNETTGVDYFHTLLPNSRPAGVARNSLQGSGVAHFDVLWEHEFALTKGKGDDAKDDHGKGDGGKVVTTGISAFNVLNHPNYNGYIGNLSSGRFGQPTSAGAGRQIQFSVGYRF